MGTMYNEDEELDFTFLRQSVRQQPKGAAAGRKRDYSGRDRMADLVSERWQSQAGQGRHSQTGQNRSAQKQTAQRQSNTQKQTAQRQNRNIQKQTAQRQNRNTQKRTAQRQSRPGTETRRSQTMQERQAALQARKKRRLRRQKQMLALLLGILLLGSLFAVRKLQREAQGAVSETGGQNIVPVQAERMAENYALETVQGIPASQYNQHPEWTEDFLTISEYSRPGEPLEKVSNIFVHYTANINTSAANNRNYFENLKDKHDVPGASAHFIIGIEGEILQIVPLNEVAYAVQTRNQDSISIECCYKYKNGQFTQETYDSLIKLLAWLVDTYDLEPEDILRHYDCGGKKCPLYYVENEDAWRILKQDVEKQLSALR